MEIDNNDIMVSFDIVNLFPKVTIKLTLDDVQEDYTDLYIIK